MNYFMNELRVEQSKLKQQCVKIKSYQKCQVDGANRMVYAKSFWLSYLTTF